MSQEVQSTVLVVDDDPTVLRAITRILRRRGYATIAIGDPERAKDLLDLVPIDAVVTDLDLPMRDGHRFVRNALEHGRRVPVIVVTGHGTLQDVWSMLDGALPSAVVPKPFVAEHLLRTLGDVLHGGATATTSCEREDTRELARSMARALALRDVETEAHARRVAIWARMLVESMGFSDDDAFWAEIGALLHDVGKIGVPDSVLHKPGPLDASEWAVMRRHPTLGGELVGTIPRLARAREVILGHHERWDGTGYPQGLAGDAIPAAARAFAVVDAYDAMTSDRPYRRGMTHAEARARITQARGTHLDPSMVEAFLAFDEIRWLSVRDAVAASESTVGPIPAAA